MKLTKLDTYEASALPGVITIKLEGSTDAQAGDVLSELTRTDNMIFLDGDYFQFLGNSRIVHGSINTYLELEVVLCDARLVL